MFVGLFCLVDAKSELRSGPVDPIAISSPSNVRNTSRHIVISVLCCLALMVVGCSEGDRSPSSRSAYLLDAEPSGAISLTEAKAVLAGDEEQAADSSDSDSIDSEAVESETVDSEGNATEETSAEETAASEIGTTEARSIVLAGKIDAGDFEPFDTEAAVFMLSELPDPDHASDDPEHADNCPFCKRRLARAPKAMVHLKGKDGATISDNAQTLTGLSKGDTVVCSGEATYDAKTNVITIAVTKVFRR